MIELTRTSDSHAEWKVKVLGIGGAGTHAVDRLTRDGLAGVEIIAVNTDARALSGAATLDRMVLGHGLTRGLGAGGDPELGGAAAQETAVSLGEKLAGASLVVLLAGLGGGTGSGATPLIAQIARSQGAHVAVFATLPFTFEGRRRREQALEALDAIRAHADLVVCFENDRMPSVADPSSGIEDAFESVDSLLAQAVRAIVSMTRRRNVMHSGLDEIAATVSEARSTAVFGYGAADGEERARAAVARAFGNPLLDEGGCLASASRLWVYVCGGPDMRWAEVQVLMSEVAERMPTEVRLFFGAAVDPQMSGTISVTLLAGIPDAPNGGTIASERKAPLRVGANELGGALRQTVPPVFSSQSATTTAASSGAVYFATSLVEPSADEDGQTVDSPQLPVLEREIHVSDQADVAANESADSWREIPPAVDQYTELVREEAMLGERSVEAGFISNGDLDKPNRVIPTPPFELSKERRQDPASVETRLEVSGERVDHSDAREEQVSFLDPVTHPVPHSILQSEMLEETSRTDSTRIEGKNESVSGIDLTEGHTESHGLEVRVGMDANAVAPLKENGKRTKDGVQEQMRFEAPNRGGRFEKTDPTIVDGEDLDVPTFMRQKLPLE